MASIHRIGGKSSGCGTKRVPNSIASSNDVPILESRKLNRSSSRGESLLNNVSVALYQGQRVALVGPSGSGKTVLLRSLAMLDPIQSGELLYRGNRPVGDAVPTYRSQVVYVHQRPPIGEGIVEDIIRAPLAFRQHAGVEFSEGRLGEWLKILDRRTVFLQKYAEKLSGGEQQIVALLRAMQLDPTVLLLDEPTAALDDQAEQGIERLVSSWFGESAESRAIVWVTHDSSQVERVADVRWSMDGGELTEVAS